MTVYNSFPDNGSDKPPQKTGTVGPFVGIGLPIPLAKVIAADRPILSLDPETIGSAGLNHLQDAVVACLLLGGKMDALDVIAALVAANYRGPLMVVAPPLPDGRMVVRELEAAGPGLKIILVQV
ncbi:MAG: hypothetical protein JXR75_08560 [Rhodobacteraceae bacterium]|nr:hypothetical protein [Paracoccaceae bacterium]